MAYNTTAHCDRALLRLTTNSDGDLYAASIHGRPIVFDLNRSCFLRDNAEIQKYGTSAFNVTGSYFSEDEVNGRPMYEDWTSRELAERLSPKREITIKTHKAVFHGRTGAAVKLKMKNEDLRGTVTGLSLRYKREAAFEATYKINEELKKLGI
jgi:hypothetical protein